MLAIPVGIQNDSSRAGSLGPRGEPNARALVARFPQLDRHDVGDVIDHQERGHGPDNPEELSIDLPGFQEVPPT
jgi:hypothetical protein